MNSISALASSLDQSATWRAARCQSSITATRMAGILTLLIVDYRQPGLMSLGEKFQLGSLRPADHNSMPPCPAPSRTRVARRCAVAAQSLTALVPGHSCEIARATAASGERRNAVVAALTLRCRTNRRGDRWACQPFRKLTD